jgi:hypothetical protein
MLCGLFIVGLLPFTVYPKKKRLTYIGKDEFQKVQDELFLFREKTKQVRDSLANQLDPVASSLKQSALIKDLIQATDLYIKDLDAYHQIFYLSSLITGRENIKKAKTFNRLGTKRIIGMIDASAKRLQAMANDKGTGNLSMLCMMISEQMIRFQKYLSDRLEQGKF